MSSNSTSLSVWLNEPDFDGQTFAPAVLLARQLACACVSLSITFGIENARQSVPLLVIESDPHAIIFENVLHPMSPVAMFGEDEQAAVCLNEPDFDFARQTGFPTRGRQVNELPRRNVAIHQLDLSLEPCIARHNFHQEAFSVFLAGTAQ